VRWIKMHRDRTLGAAVRDPEFTSPRKKERALLRETNDNSLCGHPAELRHSTRPPGEAKARKEEHSTERFVHAALTVVNVPKLHTL
jgi:hypothetical protein